LNTADKRSSVSVPYSAWRAPVTFLIEAIVGGFIFLVIALAAVALSFLVAELRRNGVDPIILTGLTSAEYAVFVVDLVLFGRFLWVTACRTWGEL